jgi:hypothetical protein
MTVCGGAGADTCEEMPERPPPDALVRDVLWLKGNAYAKNSFTQFTGNASARFQPWSPSTVVPGNGGRHARDDNATAKSRYRIFGSLFDRHRSRRDRYMDSPKT